VQEQLGARARPTDVQNAVRVQFSGFMSRGTRAAEPAEHRGLREAHWRVGGIGVRVASVDPALTLIASRARQAFARTTGRPHATVRAAWGNLAAVAAGSQVFDSGGVWSLMQDAHELRFHFRSVKFGCIPYKVARFRRDFSAGEVILHRPYFDPHASVDPLEYPLDELLVIGLLANRAGIALHGCGVADGRAGLLFLGPSGAGKSTMSRLWKHRPGVTILSDDRIIVRRVGTRMMMHGTPWHGDEPVMSPGPVELTRIFFLRHGNDCMTRRVEGVTAVAHLFACSFPPFFSAEALADTLETLEQLARATPCADLWFPNDPVAIEHIRALT
jgi:hypothetical protein